MNIKELKEFIADLPDDMEIFMDTGEDELKGNIWDFVVSPLKKPRFKRVGRNKSTQWAVAQRAHTETGECKKCLIL